MTANELCAFFIRRAPQIINAISSGAGWEIWAQVDFMIALREQFPGSSGSREVPYPWSAKKLDMIIGLNDQRYAIEMKVESATKSAPFAYRLLKDATKIETYFLQGDPQPLTKWVVGIGYSPAAKRNMVAYEQKDPANVVYQESGQDGIGVIVITVV